MKRVLIIGGSGGIGAACVEKFTKKGHQVVFTYHKNASAAAALAAKTDSKALSLNNTSPEEVNHVVDNAVKLLGGTVDVLINCAGIAEIKLFTDLTTTDWQTMLETDLSSLFYVTRAVVPYMIRNQYGKIVTVGSMWGKMGASCEVHYSAAKAGMEGFTKALAKELGPSHITVNCVEPGLIDTPMNQHIEKESLQSIIDQTPLSRIGQPKDVAEAVYFLSSDRSSFITGQILGVDGGYAI